MTNMSTTNANEWRTEHGIEIEADAEVIWGILRDVAGWKRWNAGIERIELEGPFATGTWLSMQPPGQDTFRSRLLAVRENEGFVDETRVEDLVVTVDHRIERLGPKRARVVYAVVAQGPGAEEVGPAVSADFPDVLAALAKLAKEAQP